METNAVKQRVDYDAEYRRWIPALQKAAETGDDTALENAGDHIIRTASGLVKAVLPGLLGAGWEDYYAAACYEIYSLALRYDPQRNDSFSAWIKAKNSPWKLSIKTQAWDDRNPHLVSAGQRRIMRKALMIEDELRETTSEEAMRDAIWQKLREGLDDKSVKNGETAAVENFDVLWEGRAGNWQDTTSAGPVAQENDETYSTRADNLAGERAGAKARKRLASPSAQWVFLTGVQHVVRTPL